MLQLLAAGLCAVLLVVSVVGVAAGTIKAGSGASRRSAATWRAVDAFSDESQDIDRYQRDSREGMLDQAAGLAEAALSAPTLVTPGVAPNPVGLGLGEGMSLGQLAAQALEDRQGDASQDASDTQDADSDDPVTSEESDDTGVALAEAPSTHYVAWYAENIGWNPIWITTVEEYEAYSRSVDWEGGGTDPTAELDKVALTGAFTTYEGAQRSVYGMMSDARYLEGIYSGTPVADIGGTTHNLEYVGGLQWWQ